MAQVGSIGGSAVSLLRAGPVTDYTSLDYTALQEDVTAWAQATFSDRWTDFNPTQFAVVFRDMFCYIGDLLTFHLNAGLRETTLVTAQRRQSVVNLAKMLGYTLRSASPSTGLMTVVTESAELPIAIAASDQFASGDIIFQPDQAYVLDTSNGVDNLDGTHTHAGVVTVTQGQEFSNVALGTSDGSREQLYVLPQKPLIDGTLSVAVNGTDWTEVTSFSLSNPSDEHYRVEVDDDEETSIIFGDGINGKIPPSTQAVTATWKTGGGVQGRIGADTLTEVITPITGVLEVTNPAAFTDGQDQETLRQAKSAIPLSFATNDRAVTVKDYAAVARASSTSVAKAVARELPDGRIIELFIAPTGGGVATTALKDTVSSYVGVRRMAGRQVRLLDPTYTPVQVTIDLFVGRAINKSVVKEEASALYKTPSTSDFQGGLFDFENVGFGARNDDGSPQMTVQNVFDVLDELKSRGTIQHARVSRLCNVPQLRALNVVVGDGASLFSFETLSFLGRKRRDYRLKFTSNTTYDVFERIVGSSTSLNSMTLRDDRLIADYTSLPAGSVINPNSRQGVVYHLDETASIIAGVGAFVRDASASPESYLNSASVDDPFYVEFATTSGTVAVPYTPPNDTNIQWTVVAGSTPYATGDEFIVRVSEGRGTVLLFDDEIPTVEETVSNPSPVTINVLTAV